MLKRGRGGQNAVVKIILSETAVIKEVIFKGGIGKRGDKTPFQIMVMVAQVKRVYSSKQHEEKMH